MLKGTPVNRHRWQQWKRPPSSAAAAAGLWIAGLLLDSWVQLIFGKTVEERLSSSSQLLCAEALSDSTRLRIDYQGWQFNGVDGWSAEGSTSPRWRALYSSSRAQLLLTVTFSKKQTNQKKNDYYCSDAVFSKLRLPCETGVSSKCVTDESW